MTYDGRVLPDVLRDGPFARLAQSALQSPRSLPRERETRLALLARGETEARVGPPAT